jgi:orotate phosphoribosyltransferase
MFINSETEEQVAEFLLQIKAIKLQPNNPFTWASGWKSPIYCDNRVTLSHPTIRTYIRQQLTSAIQEMFGSVGCIAGGYSWHTARCISSAGIRACLLFMYVPNLKNTAQVI